MRMSPAEAIVDTEFEELPPASEPGAKSSARKEENARVTFWADDETIEQINKFSADAGISRQQWVKNVVLAAISREFLDRQMTEGTIKGRFGGKDAKNPKAKPRAKRGVKKGKAE